MVLQNVSEIRQKVDYRSRSTNLMRRRSAPKTKRKTPTKWRKLNFYYGSVAQPQPGRMEPKSLLDSLFAHKDNKGSSYCDVSGLLNRIGDLERLETKLSSDRTLATSLSDGIRQLHTHVNLSETRKEV
jgi:hypothetical protein